MSQTTLTQPSGAELIAAVHENLFALFRAMQALPEAEVVENDQICYHHAFPTNPMFRGVWRARLEPEEVDDAVDEAIAWFGQQGAPDFLWWTDPETTPADLAERLIRRGFDGNVTGDPGMAADLHNINEDVRKPTGLTIIQVSDQKALEDWRDVFTISFDLSVSAGQAWVDAARSFDRSRVPWNMYAGYLNGKPVATSLLFTGAGVAGIYAVGTIPEARHNGIGTAITLKPLLEARQQGYRFAVLFSSEKGSSIYRRLGFREVDSRIGIYIYEVD
jgi:ribosomal protein S18 acetylase RimI-like enzyme